MNLTVSADFGHEDPSLNSWRAAKNTCEHLYIKGRARVMDPNPSDIEGAIEKIKTSDAIMEPNRLRKPPSERLYPKHGDKQLINFI
jgi:hypothetical protein